MPTTAKAKIDTIVSCRGQNIGYNGFPRGQRSTRNRLNGRNKDECKVDAMQTVIVVGRLAKTFMLDRLNEKRNAHFGWV